MSPRSKAARGNAASAGLGTFLSEDVLDTAYWREGRLPNSTPWEARAEGTVSLDYFSCEEWIKGWALL